MDRLNKYGGRQSESEYVARRRQWSRMEPTIPADFDFGDDFSPLAGGGASDGDGAVVAGFTGGVDREPDRSSPRRRKDERMASDDPMRYCADRCVSTGNCDVFEVSVLLVCVYFLH